MKSKPVNNNPHEHPFAQYVRILGKGKRGSRSFTEEEAYDAMSMIMQGAVEDVQLGAFLMLMRVKEESAEELLGFVKAVREDFPTNAIKADLDWSCYAGKRRHLPWYLLSIFLLAKNSFKVFIHGASGHTIDRIYTEDVLKAFNMPIADSWQQASDQLKAQNFCYFPLQELSPKLHHMIELRNTLGLRSPVHTLARLLNPANADTVIQGIFHPSYQPVHQAAGAALGYKRISVIKGEGGEIEVNPDATTKIQTALNGVLSERVMSPVFTKRHTKPQNLSLEHLQQVWQGQVEDEYGEASVIQTTAMALIAMGTEEETERAIEMAKAYWQERDKSFLDTLNLNTAVENSI